MKKLLLSIVLFLSFPAQAWNTWSETDKKMFIASNIAFAADWWTTREIASKGWPNGLYETNPILGRYPHPDAVDLYFVGIVVSNYFIADMLPDKHRTLYFSIRTITHGWAANNNYQLMMHYNF